ncbi:MAG: hypothetical protein GWP91_24910 [Rhodobacterales bacterium]|nr:hypothetical protein [Rhodobacterales bacterium]
MALSRSGRRLSDHEQGLGGTTSRTPNDQTMATKSNWMSNLVNSGTQSLMSPFGFDLSERDGEDQNDFYRDNAQYMPGYNIDGIPSGAWAQDRATNRVGHGTGKGNPWDNIREGLMHNESARIDDKLANGESGKLGFGDVYDAHVEEYADSGGGGNQFIDPGSFALAMYAAPALEALGMDSGAVTGASIDVFNNPEDSAFEGWAKRMGLGLGEVAAGAGLSMINPLAGAGLMGLGIGGMMWNTATAIGGEDTANWMSDQAQGALNFGGDVLDGVGNAVGSGMDAIGSGIGAIGSGISSFFGW